MTREEFMANAMDEIKIVRCNNCKYWTACESEENDCDFYGVCSKLNRMTTYDWFCADGEIRSPAGVDVHTNAVLDVIRSAPTIDAAPVRHGRWIGWHHHWAWLICNQCSEKMLVRKSNHGYIQIFPHNFCPNCGAKMRDGD